MPIQVREGEPHDLPAIESLLHAVPGTDVTVWNPSPRSAWVIAPTRLAEPSMAALRWFLNPGNEYFTVFVAETAADDGSEIAAVAIWQKPTSYPMLTPQDILLRDKVALPSDAVLASYHHLASAVGLKANGDIPDKLKHRRYLHLHLFAVKRKYREFELEGSMMDWAAKRARQDGWGLAVMASSGRGYSMFAGLKFKDHGEVRREEGAGDADSERTWRAMTKEPVVEEEYCLVM